MERVTGLPFPGLTSKLLEGQVPTCSADDRCLPDCGPHWRLSGWKTPLNAKPYVCVWTSDLTLFTRCSWFLNSSYWDMIFFTSLKTIPSTHLWIENHMNSPPSLSDLLNLNINLNVLHTFHLPKVKPYGCDSSRLLHPPLTSGTLSPTWTSLPLQCVAYSIPGMFLSQTASLFPL